jgi:hypothetical protein
MQKGCQIGQLLIRPFKGQKGDLFSAVQHFSVGIVQPSFVSITTSLGDWLCRIRLKKHSNLV